MLAAVESGDAKELAELIRQDPGFDVNIMCWMARARLIAPRLL